MKIVFHDRVTWDDCLDVRTIPSLRTIQLKNILGLEIQKQSIQNTFDEADQAILTRNACKR